MVGARGVLLVLGLAAAVVDGSPKSDQANFRYFRRLILSHQAVGQTCAALDGTVFAHAGKQSLDDLRLYADGNVQIPFTITESGATRIGDEHAEVRKSAMQQGDVVFDLRMPDKPYTAVELQLNAHDFIAVANVSGLNGSTSAVPLGDYALFDFQSQHLARSTTLPLQESTFRDLHIVLHIQPTRGSAVRSYNAGIVQGAVVPPSREAQTLYTTVAATAFRQQGTDSVALVHVPAHVPVERFTFQLDPAFSGDFLRHVSINAKPDNAQDTVSVESISGQISQTTLPSEISGSIPVDHLNQLSVDAALGADLRAGATVEIRVENGSAASLPLRAAILQMRERRICFKADPSVTSYTLRYGDDSLKAPSYRFERDLTAPATPAVAQLSSESRNPAFRPHPNEPPRDDRHTKVIWIAIFALVCALCALVLGNEKNRA